MISNLAKQSFKRYGPIWHCNYGTASRGISTSREVSIKQHLNRFFSMLHRPTLLVFMHPRRKPIWWPAKQIIRLALTRAAKKKQKDQKPVKTFKWNGSKNINTNIIIISLIIWCWFIFCLASQKINDLVWKANTFMIFGL